MLSTFALLLALAGDVDKLPVRPAADVGMSAARLSTIDRVVRRGITAGGFPGAAVVVGRRGAAVVQRGYGKLGWTSDSPNVTADATIYDLASLTKVVGTTTAIMVLWDRGLIQLDAPVSRYLPGFVGEGKDKVTVEQLLTHHSGLPAGRQLWRTVSREEAKQIVLEAPLICEPGRCFLYSDLGADILGWIVEAVSDQPLDVFLQREVFSPLEMTDTGFRPAASLTNRIAPTEVSPPRGYPLRGEVHDENAFALGGVAGHAGLFSTAADLAVYAQMMLNGGVYAGVRILSDSAVERFTKRTVGSRALGWDTADGDGGSGEYLSERAFGHTGYTGTSIWIDPDRSMFVILLTNRVHAARARRPAKVIADVRADLSDAAVLAVTDMGDQVLNMPPSFRADRADGWNPAVRRRATKSSRRRATKKATATKKASTTTRKSTAKKPVAKPATSKKSVAKKPPAKTTKRKR